MTVLSAPHLATDSGPGGIQLHVAPDHASLVRGVVSALGTSTDDPFRPIPVVVPGAGQRRHLSQAIALDAGICAGYDFVGLGELRRRVQRALLGIDAGHDQWRGRGMTLALLDVIDTHAQEPWLQPVTHHLRQAGERPGRRMATAVRLTRNFRGYVQSAPAMLLEWAAGRDVGPDEGALAPTAAWQPQLWRALRDVIGQPDPVERQRTLADALRAGPVPGLDHTLQVVDLIGVRPPDRELLELIAAHHRVELWLVDHVRSDDPHPLAASWGRARRADVLRWRSAASQVDQVAAGAPAGRHLLALVQQDVATGVVGDAPADGLTVEIHASHGPGRQVEVLRDVLCGLLEDDPTLEPRDIVVACTDLDEYAPHIHAAFGLADAAEFGVARHPGHGLRAQIAAASGTVSNSAVGLLRVLLALPGSRATSQELIDLCAHPLVAHRFGFTSDDLATIGVLVEQSGVRWGFDQRHRAAAGLGDLTHGTWTHGLDRMLAGVALPAEPESALGDLLPIAAVESGTVSLLGRLAELVALVDRSVTEYAQPASVGVWIERFRRDIDAIADVPWDDAWVLAHAHSELADLADQGASRTSMLTSAEARGLIDGLLRPPRPRANHGNGAMLFTSLDDVAGLPHRVVVVLGLDADHFPPRPRVDGDDLLGGRPGAVETDPRALARQRLMDAFMSAHDRFVVVTQGRDPRTNADRPLPVVLTDLMDACAPHLREASLVRQHSLQPQSEQNFAAKAPISFDEAAFIGARERQTVLHRPPATWAPRTIGFSADATPATDEGDLASLTAFYRHPARELLKSTLGVSLREYERRLPDELPIDVDSLTTWNLASEFLARPDLTWDTFVAHVRLTGSLPPGRLGTRALAAAFDLASSVADRARPFRTGASNQIDVAIDLPSGTRFAGSCEIVGSTLLTVTPSWIGGPQLVAAWLGLLCLAASEAPAPNGAWRAVLVGKGRRNLLVSAPAADLARHLLDELVTVRNAGLRTLLPLPPKCASELLHVGRAEPFEPDLTRAIEEWERECDHDWAAVLGGRHWGDLESVRFTAPGVLTDADVIEVARWFWRPVAEALSSGVRS